MSEETKTDQELQKQLSMDIHKLVVDGHYPLPVIVSVFEMLKVEFMLQSYMNHMSKIANDNLENIKTNMDPNFIEKIKNSKTR